MKRFSLRRRLFLFFATLAIAAVIGVQIIVIKGAEKEITEEYDAKLISDAEILWNTIRQAQEDGEPLSQTEIDLNKLVHELPTADQEKILDYADTRAFRIWLDDRLLKRSKNAPNELIPPAAAGFSDFVVGDQAWRIYTLESPDNDLIFEVRENLSGRDRLRHEILLGAAGPLIGLVLVMLAMLFLSIDVSLNEMTIAVDTIDNRSEDDLSPIDTRHVPGELIAVFDALNGLFEKLRRTIALEREFVDNAAHELRTPLTVLKLQAQLAARATDEQQRNEAVAALQTGITRAATLVEQLLTMARSGTSDAPLEATNLFTLAQMSLAVNSALPVGKNITLALEGDETTIAATNTKLATILIGVLLDNAFKYTPAGGQVNVSVINDTGPMVVIDDSGPGIPRDKREKVFERFFRIAEATTPGSGLGLAIARQIAERLGIRLSLSDPPSGGGLRVSLAFPAPIPAQG